MIHKAGKGVRQRGHQYERDVVNELKDMGFTAKTSRAQSKNRDDLGVDIVTNAPFNIQCKCLNTFKSPVHVLSRMPEERKHNIVMMKVVNRGQYVVMSKESFYKLLTTIKKKRILKEVLKQIT